MRGSSGQSREKQRHLLQRDLGYYSCEHFWLIAMILERWGAGAFVLRLYRLHSHSSGPGPFLGHHAPREQRYKKGSPNYLPPWKGSACERVCIQDLCAVCPPLQPCGGPMLPILPSLPADENVLKKVVFFFNKNEITSFFGRVSSLFSWVHFLPQPPSCPLRFSQKLVAPQQTWTWIRSKYHENHESGKISWPWPSLTRIKFWPLRHSPARSVVLDVF